MKKISRWVWNNATLSEKTRMYFEFGTKPHYTMQAAWWNNWRKAFDSFEQNCVERY